MNIQNQLNKNIDEFDKNLKDYIKNISVGQYDQNGVNIGFLKADVIIANYLKHSQLQLLQAVVEELKDEFEKGIYMQEPALIHVAEKFTKIINDNH